MYIVSTIVIAEIPMARSPVPGMHAMKPTLYTPPGYFRGVTGPGTFERTIVALFTTYIRENRPITLGSSATSYPTALNEWGISPRFSAIVCF